VLLRLRADKNHFAAIQQDQDYKDLLDAVSQITATPNITLGPKPSQKQRKATRLSPQRIAALAKDINDGKIK
jgi:hypothetical protein